MNLTPLRSLNWFTVLAVLNLAFLVVIAFIAWATLPIHIAAVLAGLAATTGSITSAVLSLHFTRR